MAPQTYSVNGMVVLYEQFVNFVWSYCSTFMRLWDFVLMTRPFCTKAEVNPGLWWWLGLNSVSYVLPIWNYVAPTALHSKTLEPPRIIICPDRRTETKQEIEGKIIGSDREGLGIGLGLGIRIADLNQIADLNLTPCNRLCLQSAECIRVTESPLSHNASEVHYDV